MVIFLWSIFCLSFFSFHLLVYILVITIHHEHPNLYKKLGEPSFLQYLQKSSSLRFHPLTIFLFSRHYRISFQDDKWALRLSQLTFTTLILQIFSIIALVLFYMR